MKLSDKLKARDFHGTSLSTYDFSTLYTTLPYNLIKDKLIYLIERTFQREGYPDHVSNGRNMFFTLEQPKTYVCDVVTFLLDTIFIRFDTRLYRQVVVIPKCFNNNCAPLVVDSFLFCFL